MAGIKIVNLPALGRDLISTDLFELSLVGGSGSRKITGQEIMNASKLNVGGTSIINGTAGRILFQGAGDVLGESANLFWDNTNGRLGVGTNAPSGRIHVKGSVASEIFKAESTIAALYAQFVSTDGAGEFGIYTDAFYFQPLSSLANGTRFLNGANTVIMQLAQTGNVLINTTTDAGYKLDVNGTARFGILSATTVFGDYNGGGQSSVAYKVDFAGGWGWGISNMAKTQWYFEIRSSGQAIFGSGNTNYLSLSASAKVQIDSTTQGFLPPRMTTTQKNAIASPATGLEVFDSTTLTPSIYNGTNWQNVLVPTSNGNVLINTTTDLGYKLDVNGTSNFRNTLNIDTVITGGSTLLRVYSQGPAVELFKITENQVMNLNCAQTYLRSNGSIYSQGTDGIYFNAITWYPQGDTRYGFNFFGNLFAANGSNSSLTLIRVNPNLGNFSVGTTNTANVLMINPTINQVNTGTHTVRGIYYNPTLTSTTGTTHFAIHTTSGRVRFEGLPTSPTGLNAGDLYNNLGVLMIV